MKEKEIFVRNFREVQPKFSRLCMSHLVKSGLTMPQFALLNLVAAGPVPMKDLSERLFVSKPAVTNLVDRLEKHAFLKRIQDKNDRRVSLIEIRPKGQKIIRDMQSSALSVLLQALEKFTPSERKAVTRFYEVLSSCLDLGLSQGNKIKK